MFVRIPKSERAQYPEGTNPTLLTRIRGRFIRGPGHRFGGGDVADGHTYRPDEGPPGSGPPGYSLEDLSRAHVRSG